MANGYKLRFIQDDSVEQTEVIIRAKSQDEEVERILSALGEDSAQMLLCETLSSSRLIDKKNNQCSRDCSEDEAQCKLVHYSIFHAHIPFLNTSRICLA